VRHQVTFARSGKEVAWERGSGNLLELAERAGVPLDAGCRAGNCGTCQLTIQRGSVLHQRIAGQPLAANVCLACIAVPQEDLVLDA
jgi:ferredoxin